MWVNTDTWYILLQPSLLNIRGFGWYQGPTLMWKTQWPSTLPRVVCRRTQLLATCCHHKCQQKSTAVDPLTTSSSTPNSTASCRCYSVVSRRNVLLLRIVSLTWKTMRWEISRMGHGPWRRQRPPPCRDPLGWHDATLLPPTLGDLEEGYWGARCDGGRGGAGHRRGEASMACGRCVFMRGE